MDYNAGSTYKLQSLMLDISPELSPSICIFKYHPYYVDKNRKKIFAPKEKKSKLKSDDLKDIYMFVEYYPYPKNIISSIINKNKKYIKKNEHIRKYIARRKELTEEEIEEEIESGFDTYFELEVRQFIKTYPDYGYIRIHFLKNNFPSKKLSIPEKIISFKDISDLAKALDVTAREHIGYSTEGIISLQALDNINFNLNQTISNNVIKDRRVSNMELVAQYLPCQVGYDAIRSWYENFCGFKGVSNCDYKLTRQFLIANKRAYYQQSTQNFINTDDKVRVFNLNKKEAEIAFIDKDKNYNISGSKLNIELYCSPNDQISDFIIKSGSIPRIKKHEAVIDYNEKNTLYFAVREYIGSETLYPVSIEGCFNKHLISKIKQYNPQEHLFSYDKLPFKKGKDFSLSDFKGYKKRGEFAKNVPFLIPSCKEIYSHYSFLDGLRNIETKINDEVERWIRSYDVNKFTAISTSSGVINNVGYIAETFTSIYNDVNVFFPAATAIKNLFSRKYKDANNPSEDIFSWFEALNDVSTIAETTLSAGGYIWANMAHASVYAGPILSCVANFCKMMDDIKKYKNLKEKSKNLEIILAHISTAISSIPEDIIKLDPSLGNQVSKEVTCMVQQDLKELNEIIIFYASRYKMDLSLNETDIILDTVSLQIILVSAALSFVTAGAAMVVGSAAVGTINTTTSAVRKFKKIRRFRKKVDEFDSMVKENSLVLDKHNKTLTPSLILSERNKVLQDLAKDISKNTKTQLFFARFLTLNFKSIPKKSQATTIDEYYRVKLASFLISTNFRVKTQQDLGISGPTQVIANLADLLIDFIGDDIRKEIFDFIGNAMKWGIEFKDDLEDFSENCIKINDAYRKCVSKTAKLIR